MMLQTKVKDIMTREPAFIKLNANLQQAAMKMERYNCGVLPVGTEDDVVGIITDHDIVIRAVAQGLNPSIIKVEKAMIEIRR